MRRRITGAPPPPPRPTTSSAAAHLFLHRDPCFSSTVTRLRKRPTVLSAGRRKPEKRGCPPISLSSGAPHLPLQRRGEQGRWRGAPPSPATRLAAGVEAPTSSSCRRGSRGRSGVRPHHLRRPRTRSSPARGRERSTGGGSGAVRGSLLSLPWRPCSLARSSTIPCSTLVVGRAREPTRSAGPAWDEGVRNSLRIDTACRRQENEGPPPGDRC
jgi:hypothetical protein